MKNSKIYLVCILILSSTYTTHSQEYTYFNIKTSNENLIRFIPKHLTYFDRERGTGTDGYQIDFNQVFFDMYTPIFNEVFGHPYTGDTRLLSKTTLTFYFGKDFKPYYFSVLFPANRKDEFAGLEEKIYTFGMKCMQTNFQPFVQVWDKEKFQGSSFAIMLYGFYLYSEGKLNIF